MKKIKIFFTATLICFAFHIHAKDYYVSDFGAKADGKNGQYENHTKSDRFCK